MPEILSPSFFYRAGPTGVLLIHGFTASPAEMLPLGEYLHHRGISCLGVRLAGHGTSLRDLLDTSWLDWYAAAAEGLEELDKYCDQVFVAGLSMGGLLAVLLAREYPQRLRGLSLLAPAFYPCSPFLFLASWLRPFVKTIHKSERSKTYLRENDLFSYPSMPLPALTQLYRLIKEGRRALPHIVHPTQIFLGKQDHTVKPASGLHLFNCLGCEKKGLIYLPNSGHILTVEPDAPTLFAAVYRFICNRDTRTYPR